MKIGVVFATAWAALVVPALAAADPTLQPIQPGQSYAIDLYSGVPLGNSAVIATGGASQAYSIGSSGTLVNASAPAVRQTTDTDAWNWDYHVDWLIGSLSSDYANSGIANLPDGHAQTITLGGALRVHDWAGALTATYHTIGIDSTGGALDAQSWFVKLALAKWFSKIDTSIGISIDTGSFDVVPDAPGAAQLFSIEGAGLEAGAQWIPRRESFRVGASLVAPITGSKVTIDQCTGATICMYLPDRVVTPAQLSAGVAYRWAETAWNQTVGGTFRDERSLTALADVVITGPSPDAYGLDAFGIEQLERSGRHNSISVRGGVEYEWVPGRFRVRGGSYWEPNRFEGVAGRLHATFGIEGRVFEFQAWGRRRGRITLTGDVAAGYRNLGLSIGFWH
ncbi:MAG TPA: hypothetical protein VIV58_20180 [Kofleriaceae bacterium]